MFRAKLQYKLSRASLALAVLFTFNTFVLAADEAPPTDTPSEAPAETPTEPAKPAPKKVVKRAPKAAVTAATAHWQITYKDEKGESQTTDTRVTLMKENDLILIALDWHLPWNDATAVTETDEAGAESELSVSTKSDGPHVNLVSSKATLTIKRPAGSVKISYVLNPSTGLLRVDKSCRKAGLKLQALDAKPSVFPAVLVCKVTPGSSSPVEIVFSTMKDADWLGSDAFEIAGKGERFKTFSYGDASALINWHLNWGSADNRVAYQVTFPNVMIPKPAPPIPSTTFEVGIAYMTGSFTSTGTSTTLSGFELPLSVVYKRATSSWFVGGGYDLFLYSLAKETAGSATTSLLQAYGGFEQRFGSFGVREGLGLIDRSIDLPTLGITANFQAPKVTLELFSEGKASQISARVGYAMTATAGNFNELNANLSYTFTKPSHEKRFRIGLNMQSLKASQNDLAANGQWYTAEFGFDF